MKKFRLNLVAGTLLVLFSCVQNPFLPDTVAPQPPEFKAWAEYGELRLSAKPSLLDCDISRVHIEHSFAPIIRDNPFYFFSDSEGGAIRFSLAMADGVALESAEWADIRDREWFFGLNWFSGEYEYLRPLPEVGGDYTAPEILSVSATVAEDYLRILIRAVDQGGGGLVLPEWFWCWLMDRSGNLSEPSSFLLETCDLWLELSPVIDPYGSVSISASVGNWVRDDLYEILINIGGMRSDPYYQPFMGQMWIVKNIYLSDRSMAKNSEQIYWNGGPYYYSMQLGGQSSIPVCMVYLP